MSPSLSTIFHVLLIVTLATSHPTENHPLVLRTDSGNNGTALLPSDTPTSNPGKCPSGTKYFTQLVDHAASGCRDSSACTQETFLQQYQVIDTYFKPGGPILYYQGAESPYFCLEYTTMMSYANQTGALLVSQEHRYFGISSPYGLNYSNSEDWTVKDMDQLTLNNVQMDAVRMLEWVQRTVPGASNSKVIAFGGSYAGILALWHRVFHPEMFYGVVAWSSPTKLDTSPSYATVIGDRASVVISDASFVAAEKIKGAFKEIRYRMASNDFAGLEEDLQLCYAPNSTDQASKLLTSLAGGYTSLMKSNNAGAQFPLDAAIRAGIAADSNIAAVGAMQKINNALSKTTCADWNPSARVSADTGLPFEYIRCTYVPYPDIFTSADTVFGPLPPDFAAGSARDATCQRLFGFNSVVGGPAFQRMMRIDDATLQHTDRLIIVMGGVDSVSGLAPNQWWVAGVDSRNVLLTGGAHGTEGILPTVNDTAATKWARVMEVQAIERWNAGDSS